MPEYRLPYSGPQARDGIAGGLEASSKLDNMELQVTALLNSTNAVNSKIPSAATSSNQLADKAWVTSQGINPTLEARVSSLETTMPTKANQSTVTTIQSMIPPQAAPGNQLADKQWVQMQIDDVPEGIPPRIDANMELEANPRFYLEDYQIGMPMTFSVYFALQQQGTGNPSMTNVRPIFPANQLNEIWQLGGDTRDVYAVNVPEEYRWGSKWSNDGTVQVSMVGFRIDSSQPYEVFNQTRPDGDIIVSFPYDGTVPVVPGTSSLAMICSHAVTVRYIDMITNSGESWVCSNPDKPGILLALEGIKNITDFMSYVDNQVVTVVYFLPEPVVKYFDPIVIPTKYQNSSIITSPGFAIAECYIDVFGYLAGGSSGEGDPHLDSRISVLEAKMPTKADVTTVNDINTVLTNQITRINSLRDDTNSLEIAMANVQACIPPEATSTNLLADREYVSAAIQSGGGSGGGGASIQDRLLLTDTTGMTGSLKVAYTTYGMRVDVDYPMAFFKDGNKRIMRWFFDSNQTFLLTSSTSIGLTIDRSQLPALDTFLGNTSTQYPANYKQFPTINFPLGNDTGNVHIFTPMEMDLPLVVNGSVDPGSPGGTMNLKIYVSYVNGELTFRSTAGPRFLFQAEWYTM